MTRGALRAVVPARSDSVFEAVNNLAEHGILAVRRKKNGEILQVKTAVFGWITAGQFSLIQSIKNHGDIVGKLIEGGYIINAAIFTVAIPLDIISSGTSIPLGPLLMLAGGVLALIDNAAGFKLEALLDIIWPILPFGAFYILYRVASDLWNVSLNLEKATVQDLKKLPGAISQGFWASPLGQAILAVDPNAPGQLQQALGGISSQQGTLAP